MAAAFKSSAMAVLLAANLAIFMAASVGAAKRQYVHLPEECARRLTLKCGKEVSNGVFRDKTISEYCCRRLLIMGFNCYKRIAFQLVRAPEVKTHAEEFLLKVIDTWDTCSLKASHSPLPSPAL